ncbi:MAG: thioredoxin domain-containing protein [bacterium]|nr:thioredoxin domain-containing protein [bacterium]
MDEQKETGPAKSSSLTIPIAIILAGVIIAGAVYLRGPTGTNNQAQVDQFKVENKDIVIKPVSADDHILGNPNADIVVVEYSDTECPFCKNFHKSMQQLVAEYGKNGKVAWVYRHFPIEQLHSKAAKEAEATECAADVGGKSKFWDYIGKVFEVTPSNDGLDPAELLVIAGNLGLDKTAFQNCLNSGKFTKKIADSIKEAQDAGAQGTPYSVIVDKKGNTYPIDGSVPYADLKSVVDGILKGK